MIIKLFTLVNILMAGNYFHEIIRQSNLLISNFVIYNRRLILPIAIFKFKVLIFLKLLLKIIDVLDINFMDRVLNFLLFKVYCIALINERGPLSQMAFSEPRLDLMMIFDHIRIVIFFKHHDS